MTSAANALAIGCALLLGCVEGAERLSVAGRTMGTYYRVTLAALPSP